MRINMYRAVLDGCRYPSIVAEKGNRYVCDGRKEFCSPEVVYDFCAGQLEMNCLAEEYTYCFALNNKCHLMGVFEVSHGTYNASLVSVRDIFQKLLLLNASAFILAHNHPSGDPTPSTEDFTITDQLRNAGEVLGIKLIDHIVIGSGNYFSFNEYERK